MTSQRVNVTTHKLVMVCSEADGAAVHSINGQPPYPDMDDQQRKVARDAYVSWKGSRYSVPCNHAGNDVRVLEHGSSGEIGYTCR